MTATADLIIERRQMRRRLALWRILAIVAVIGAVITGIASSGFGLGGERQSGDHVAVVRIDGIILSDAKRAAELRKIAEDDTAKALVVQINSPGGTVTGSEDLFDSLRKVAENKPVVAQMGDAAASGGYIAAIAADHIVARGNSITGSIGVVAEAPNIARFLSDNGIDVIRIKSSPLKAEPGFLTPPAEGAIEAQQALIADSFQWFKGLVGERRSLEGASLDAVSDGRIFTGRLALEAKLVDALGARAEVDTWLEETHEIDSDLERRERDWREPEVPWFLRTGAAALGLGDWIDRLAPAAARLQPGFRLYAIMH